MESQTAENPMPEPAKAPSRHWSFNAWLILAAILYLIAVIWLHNLFGALNLIFIFALYKWRKWGFFGFLFFAVVFFVLRLSDDVTFSKSALSLIAPTILFGVLNVGGDKKAWPRLK